MAPEMARALAMGVFAPIGLAACLATPAHALRVVDYNLLNYPGSTAATRNPLFRTVVAPLGADVLVAEEVISQAGVDLFRDQVLNGVEPGQWAAAPFTDGNDTESALFYKPAKLTFLGHWTFYPNAANQLRLVHVWRMRPTGYTSGAAEIRFYSVHLKASMGFEAQRLAEAAGMRDSMNAAPAGTHCIAVGDFNFYRGTEPGMAKLLELQADNDGRVYDPLGLQNQNWQDNAGMLIHHTQSPCFSGGATCAGGAATGGVDDRFDLVLPTYNFQDGTGLELLTATYRAVGNDGLHQNKNITDPPTIPEGAAYADALIRTSDHLPVRVDLSLPAIFVGAAALDLGTVIEGGAASYTVSNAAAAPADGLSHTLAATTGFAAPAGMLEVAPSASAAHAIAAQSGGPLGARVGTLMIATDAPDAPSVAVSLTANVLGHAAASLDSAALAVADTLDFDHPSGAFTALDVRVHNVGWNTLRARLALGSAAITGPDAARFSWTPPADGLIAGEGKSCAVQFDEAGATPDHTYAAVLTVPSADEPLPGAAAQPDLTVQLRGIVRSGTTGVEDAPPRFTRLLAPFPNPLVQAATVRFDLARAGRTRIGVYDLSGRRVAGLADRGFEAGRHTLRWNGRNDAGIAVDPGVYFIHMNGPQGERAAARIAVVR